VQGGREFDFGAVLHECWEGCSDSRRGSYNVCGIGERNGAPRSVRSGNSLNRALKSQSKEERPERVPWRTPPADTTSTMAFEFVEDSRTDYGMSAVHKACKLERGRGAGRLEQR
jgi:hypothetical protein